MEIGTNKSIAILKNHKVKLTHPELTQCVVSSLEDLAAAIAVEGMNVLIYCWW